MIEILKLNMLNRIIIKKIINQNASKTSVKILK